MLHVGVIGCGNAGNQTVSAMHKKYADIPVLALNCSENDLAVVDANIPRRVVGDGKGAGKNRAESKKFLAQNISELVSDDEIKKFMKGLDIVFIVSSTGGGTGSGMSLLLTKILATGFPGVFPIPVGILPSISEQQSTQSNSLEYLLELYTLLDNPTYMLYDNEKGHGMATSKMMAAVNNQIVEDINILRGFYNVVTKYSSIDEKDGRVLVMTPGRLVVASLFNISDRMLETRGVDDMLCEFIKTGGYHVPIQRDKIIKRSGLIVSMYTDMMADLGSTLPKVEALVGSATEGFEHLVETEDRKAPNYVFYIMAGLTKINDRIATINERIKEIEEAQRRTEDDDELDPSIIAAVTNKKEYRKSDDANQSKADLSGMFQEFGINIEDL